MDSRTLVTAVLAAAALSAAGCRQIPEPGQRMGDDRIFRMILCDLPEIGEIRNLEWLPAEGGDGALGRLWIGGDYGAVQTTRDGEERERVVFSRRIVNPLPIDVDADGMLETMACGGGWSDVGLLDADGQLAWMFPAERAAFRAGDAMALFGPASPDAMAAGPIGADGDVAFVVGMNAGDGLHFLDACGHVFRSYRGSNVFSVAVADLDGDGAVEILHSDGRGSDRWIQVRDEHGCRQRRIDLDFEAFGLVRWPDAHSPPRLSGGDEDSVQIVDPCAEPGAAVLAELELPDEGFSVDHGQVLPVLLDPAAEPYVAVQRTIRATWQRSALYLFDSQRRLVYHEVFPFSHIGIVAAPARAPGGAEELLVGAGSRVCRYELRLHPPSPAASPVAN